MLNTIYLEPAMVPAHLRGAYRGTKFQAEVCESMSIPSDAGLWSGGSREVYSAIDFATGQQMAIPGQHLSPWNAARTEHKVELKPGFAIVRHSMFCGKDMGLTFYVHPENATKLLPAPVELTPHEKTVLEATCGLKSSYNGKDRYEMSLDNSRWERKGTPFMSRAEWDAAKASLIGRGMLNKAGAVTVAGRNANRR